MTLFTYDHSLDGFLTAVFEVYEYKANPAQIRKEGIPLPLLFTNLRRVISDRKKADRVYQKLKLLMGADGLHKIIYALLSEDENCEIYLLSVIQIAIANQKLKIWNDYTNPSILKISQLVKQVGREKHRMEAFVRFSLTCDGIYFSEIEPDFNVLPIIAKHFSDRYQDQKWLIFDNKRNYGIYYNLVKVEMIEMTFNSTSNQKLGLEMLAKDEELYKRLWRTYFDKTNIKARKNTRLHVQHVPKRYWKYLTEKTGL
jgi:probable DNA metabolism protein